MPDPKVLLIDDDEVIHDLVRASLGDDYHVDGAYSGQEGINAAHSKTADIVLLDINLPDMKGFEICRKLRQGSATGSTPIIMISSTEDREEQLHGYELGADDFIPKPIDMCELLVKVEQGLGRAKMFDAVKRSSELAANSARAAIKTSSDMGELLRFMERTMSEQDPIGLAQDLLMTTMRFGFDCCVQLHAMDLIINYDGNLLPDDAVESKMMTFARTKGKIKGAGQRTFFNQEFATILVKNMPVDDELAQGRSRETLCMLIDAANSVMRAIRLREELIAIRSDNMHAVVRGCIEELSHLPEYLREVSEQSQGMIDRIKVDLEGELLALDLSEAQEMQIFELINKQLTTADSLKETEFIIENTIESVYERLKTIIQM